MNQDREKRILVVDDEPDIVTYLTTLLEDHGYATDQAADAGEAEKILADQAPDLVCLDIMMPRQSGIALYKKIKQEERTSNVPVLFISAFSTARDFMGRRFRKLIVDTSIPEPEGYLEKPVRAEDLISIVDRILKLEHP